MNGTESVAFSPDKVWDVVVVGTGMGGATAGYELARTGREVLFVEKGPFVHATLPGAPVGLRAAELNPAGAFAEANPAGSRYGWWPHPVSLRSNLGNLEFPLPVGCGTGGSTAFYAAGLERFAPDDFSPRANFPDVADSSLPEHWPISYEELRPFYERAEELFRVRGTPDPLFTGGASRLLTPWPMSAEDEALAEALRSSHLNPYRVHAGFENIPGCDGCPTGHCPKACKSDSAWICLVPALARHGAKIIADCEVIRLEAEGTRVHGVLCQRGSERFTARAQLVILAAGALSTPSILLKSTSKHWPAGLANASGLVGRNLMFHAGDFVALRGPVTRKAKGPRKTLALNDFYFASGRKLGTFQMLGVSLSVDAVMQHLRDSSAANPAWWAFLTRPDPGWWRKLMSPPLRLAVTIFCYVWRFNGAAIWASILEDLPYRHNRVYPNPADSQRVVIEYRFSDELRHRIEYFRERLRAALGRRGAFVLTPEFKIDYPHAAGTCRFGDDPQHSVLDRNNKAHGVDNLYVVDASFLPSSAGTNPSLTVAANALRVAALISRSSQLGESLPDASVAAPQSEGDAVVKSSQGVSAERVVAVTGAGGGLGTALVRAFLEAGYRVVGLGRSDRPPEGMVSPASMERFHWYRVDVGDWSSVEHTFGKVLQDLGRIDVLLNNAAVYPRDDFLAADVEEWTKAVATNLLGPAYCSRAVLPSMIERGYGRIFNVGSFADGAPIERSSAYSVSKGGLHALSKAIAADIRPLGRNIQVHEWVPGHLKTRMSEFTGLEPAVSAAWALAIVEADAASSDSVLYVNESEYVPPKGLKSRILGALRVRR